MMILHRSAGSPADEVSAGERSTLRAVAVPTEHGGRSLTLEPILLALVAVAVTLAWHIRIVTVAAVLFVLAGASIRFGGYPVLER